MPFVFEPQRAPNTRTYFDNHSIHILCIGKYEPRKHHLMLLEIAEKLHDKYPLHLTLIGEATTAFQKEYHEKVEAYVKEHHMDGYVTVKTNVPRKEMEDEYTAADIYVIPSTREMASVSQLEAMSYSLPVICSDANGTASYVEDGITGYQFRDCDQDDLLRKLEFLMSDQDRIRQMGTAGYLTLMEKYNFDHYYNKVMQMREKILQEHLY